MAQHGTRLLKMSVAGTDYTAQISKSAIKSKPADSDFTTFTDAASGGLREYSLEFTAVQDSATGTLWDKVWTGAGTSVACILMPHGNATPTVAQPHFTFTATVTEPDGDLLGGEADPSTTARHTFTCVWVLAAKPVKVTA